MQKKRNFNFLPWWQSHYESEEFIWPLTSPRLRRFPSFPRGRKSRCKNGWLDVSYICRCLSNNWLQQKESSVESFFLLFRKRANLPNLTEPKIILILKLDWICRRWQSKYAHYDHDKRWNDRSCQHSEFICTTDDEN
jgi:hypothetical protein